MASKNTTLSTSVKMSVAEFRRFAAFDVLKRQKRWIRPLLFMLLMLVFAGICYSQVGKREGALLLGIVLAVVAVGLPVCYFGSYFHSVTQQAKKMGLLTPQNVYRVDIAPEGLHVQDAGRGGRMGEAHDYPWESLFGVWKTKSAIYLFVEQTKAYILPGVQIKGGTEAAWALLNERIAKEKLHG